MSYWKYTRLVCDGCGEESHVACVRVRSTRKHAKLDEGWVCNNKGDFCKGCRPAKKIRSAKLQQPTAPCSSR